MESILDYQPNAAEDYYALLGCDELSTPEQIQAEYRARVVGSHPDKAVGDEKDDAHQRFQLLQRAKEVLCDPALKRSYDAWRRAGIAVSFKDWIANQSVTQMSMHWASSKPKKAMIMGDEQIKEAEGAASVSAAQPTQSPWARYDSDVVRKFRQYEI
uniref:J domain-containing protein n=1 Tax=Plectus sambesii TaxID=2011161 RepID=A0A914UJW9_9BILA